MAVLTPHRSCPAAETTALIAVVNDLAASLAALLAKLDLDPTIAATDFASVVGTIDTISPSN